MKISEMNEIIMIKNGSRGGPRDSHKPAQSKTLANMNSVREILFPPSFFFLLPTSILSPKQACILARKFSFRNNSNTL